jgi:STE24 endopeptidase
VNPYLVFVLIVLIGSYLLDLLVDILNLKYHSEELPEEFEGFYNSNIYAKSQKYLQANTRLGIVLDTVTTPIIILFILIGGFQYLDTFVRGFDLGPILTGLMFTGILLFAFHVLHIPFSVYGTFYIEEKYGFNRTTVKTFIFDILKSWFLAAVLGGIALIGVLWFFEKAGAWAWLFCWGGVTAFQIIIMFLAPVLIMPLFNKFTPLREGELKEAIEGYARSQQFKMKGVFTMDGSKRSSKTNAFFAGIGRFRRVVLFDTLIEKHSVRELVSVLAHEVAHYKKRHVFKSLTISIVTMGVMFYILSVFLNNPELFAAFKMEKTSIYGSLVFFAFLFSPIEMILSVLGNYVSRKHEFEADRFAVLTSGYPQAMIQALKKLSVENLSNLNPHPLKVFLSYSHPPVLQRIQAIQTLRKRTEATSLAGSAL